MIIDVYLFWSTYAAQYNEIPLCRGRGWFAFGFQNLKNNTNKQNILQSQPRDFFFFFPKRILFAASAADECLTFTMFFHIWMWRCYIYMVHTLCWLFFNVRFLLHKKTNQLWISALLYRFWSTCLMYTQQVICCGYDRVKERTIECSVGPPLTPGCLRQMWRGGRKKTGRGWGFLKLARATFWEKKKKREMFCPEIWEQLLICVFKTINLK